MGIDFVEPIAFCAFKIHCGIKANVEIKQLIAPRN